MERTMLLIFALAFALQVGCATASSQLADIAHASMPENQDESEQLNQRIRAALETGRYADAIDAVRGSRRSGAEIDFSVAEVALQALADPAAVQRPGISCLEAIALLEKSALAGHPQAISGLAALFFTGLKQDGAEGRELVASNQQLHACWKAAKADPKQAAQCVALRLAPDSPEPKTRAQTIKGSNTWITNKVGL